MPRPSAGHTNRVRRALRARRDVWGEALIRSRNGPTYAGVARRLRPLLFARGSRSRAPEVHYVAFAQPSGRDPDHDVALHLADGSAIAAQRVTGPRLTIRVGSRGARYGACLARLAPPRLASGYLPILQTRYTDGAGVRYRQESFATRIGQTRSLVAFVALTAVVPGPGRRTTRLAFALPPRARGLTARGRRLVRGPRTYLFFSPGGRFDGRRLTYSTGSSRSRTVYVAWLVEPASSANLALSRSTFRRARSALIAYWRRRLAEGAILHVPEPRVMSAQRNLLVQNLAMTWRYSLGNDYEHLAVPESIDAGQVLGEYGFFAADREILGRTLRRPPRMYPNWGRGQRLLGAAVYYRLSRDRRFIRRWTPTLRRYVAELRADLARGGYGLLPRERYSSDIPTPVYGAHSQAVAWQGLRTMAAVWAAIGDTASARAAAGQAAALRRGLRRAIGLSARRLSDRTLFVPVRLLDGERPYASLTASRFGRYWNLVMPYALASGIFQPRSSESHGILGYLQRHGSRFLGLVRFASRALSHHPQRAVEGSDNVYALNTVRFLADNDRPEQLVLALYGQLAGGMTRGTFVSGEAATIAAAPAHGYRSMYLPPNSTSNASFLETLRLTLVHETRDRKGVPRGLELAFATPRAWLAPGRRIAARRVPTSFGRISLAISSRRKSVDARLWIPPRTAPRTLRLRLRRPDRERIVRVDLDGRRVRRFDPQSETLDLSGHAGRVALRVAFG